MSPRERSPRGRRARTVRESLGSIVLGFESVIVFLATLVAFGLRAADPVVVLVGGALLCLALVGTVGLLRSPLGFRIGWVLQFVIVAAGLLVPLMYVIGAAFVALWSYCMLTGRRLDAQSRGGASGPDRTTHPTEGDR